MSQPRTGRSGVSVVLVVDDDEVMRELLLAILATGGYAVRAVSSGAEALEWLGREAADVVLADLHMPGMQGAALALRLREAIRPGTVLMGMSGSDPSDEEPALFDAFLPKPFGLEDFVRAVADGSQSRMAAAPTDDTRTLDEAVYSKLAGMLPKAKLKELYSVCLDDVLQRVERMRAATARGDMEDCRREAHAIKGSCSMVGAIELSALAAEIEMNRTGRTPVFETFSVACARLRRVLSAHSDIGK